MQQSATANFSTDARAKPQSPSLAELENPPRDLKKGTIRIFLYALAIAILAWSYQGAEIRPMALIKDAGNMATFSADFFPPDFHEWRYYLDEIVITLHIAIWGTLLSVIAAIPFGLLAASNIAPWWIHQPVRRLMDAFRAINEMVFAMLFVVAVGLGPFAGVMALFIHTTGILAKLFSEAVEAIDPQPVEGIRATGATQIEEICYGVIPQVMPLWTSYALYRFESNVRAAAVVGMVGAGGIGVVLWEVIRGFQFSKTAAVMIMLIVTVSLVDMISARIRKLFI
jgi:phosphonate transport system permease protein